MKFFVPLWDDKLDPTFNFQTDTFTPDRIVSQDQYAHQLFSTPPYSGLLLSRAILEDKKADYEALQSQGAHTYLRLPPGLEVFGDCGAFTYVNEQQPRYTTEDVLDYYHTIGVDYGASVDHLVFDNIYVTEEVQETQTDGTSITKQQRALQPMSSEERDRRIQLTLDNALRFITLHKKYRHSFTPVGVAQGFSFDSYATSVSALLKMGYDYIALGGLARSNATQVLNTLKAAKRAVDSFPDVTPSHIRFHLFGVAKMPLLNDFPTYGVASIDSASYLRKAWLRSGQNYLAADGTWYTAIRVPQSHNPKVEQYVSLNCKSIEQVRTQEAECLQLLERHGTSPLLDKDFEHLLDILADYDTYLLRLGDDGQAMRDRVISRELYRRTLQARPWEKCPCDVCKSIGIHALIFRGTNRNKRRGFHNTWTFFQRLNTPVPTSNV